MEDPPAQATLPAVVRTYEEELGFITKINDTCYAIQPGFVPNMRVPGVFYVNERLSSLMFDELKQYIEAGGVGGFMPAMKQIANVSGLPGIVGVRRALTRVCARGKRARERRAHGAARGAGEPGDHGRRATAFGGAAGLPQRLRLRYRCVRVWMV